jgi:hypothetical protein
MDRGPVALFGAIVAVGLGPAMWLGVQFGGIEVDPSRPPAVVGEPNSGPGRLLGGSGAGADETGDDSVIGADPQDRVPLTTAPSPKPSATTPSPAGPPTSSRSAEPSGSSEPTTPPTEATTTPTTPPTDESSSPTIPPESPSEDDPGAGDPTDSSSADTGGVAAGSVAD